MKRVTLFCDGSSLGNPGDGGWAAILRYGEVEKELSGGEADATNNQMELLAVIKGLEALKEPCEVELYSDSSYVVKGINEWLKNWVAKSFKGVKNPDLWRHYIEAAAKHKVRANWVRGHNGHSENERCDTLAKEAAMRVRGRE